MKKYILFFGVFVSVFLVLQIFSGMLLTLFYTPSISLDGNAALSSTVEFGNINIIPTIIFAFIALAASFISTKLLSKKMG
ncbi:hypothetical protein AN964_22330 [Heyndrickxia shackletonii]|uniref:Uncharacterized protein n=1 Tax=Heyndrickxia shackletonii TaxID=157838 RepID=A0A0Q3WQB8_9BACI|nr:hypothetical protein [Heyndrickxia shackletonii]KQL50405.1 hypothetical protein AN964_22330 [Heyndrickxia shackletonii]NEZ00867.1 hypothetical protein [Heyndrickxia shackletonii]